MMMVSVDTIRQILDEIRAENPYSGQRRSIYVSRDEMGDSTWQKVLDLLEERLDART